MTESRPYRVLLVCTGNTCRTAMAEPLLRDLLAAAGIEADVRSAGTHALAGAPAHPDARAAAGRVGLDLAGHRAQPLTAELVRWADVVLGMSRGHVERARLLDDAAEIRLITEFDPAGPHERGVLDPIGYEPEVYEAVLDDIRSCLERFVEARASDSREG
ncbi:MAG TPA: low molecular weight phosphotyrosine protein phosphatase [Gemmatimonadota bacterium]|nr:low molecular weight phosphotyrosine protein phosphatase [Gemmatimonadota bacterium]